MMNEIVSLDKSVFYFLNDLHTPLFDVAMSLFTRTEAWLLLFVGVIWCIFKLFGRKGILILIAIALVILIADQFSGLIKDLVGRLRPTHDPDMQDLVHFVKKKGGKFSYFSAHASNTFGLAMFLSLLFKNRTLGLVIFSWAAIASYTRIYLGLHFPGDILTGMLFGMVLGWAVYQLVKRVDKRFFALSSSKVGEAKLDAAQARLLLLLFVVVVFSTIFIADRLLHIGLITL